MSPYIRTSHRPATLESTIEDRESPYLARNATIRTVASSDPISPRRPAFFGESPRGREGSLHHTALRLDASGKKYHKEMWANAWEPDDQNLGRFPKDAGDRPQTSPYSPLGTRTFFLDEDEGDAQLPSPPFRGTLSGSRAPDGRHLAEGRGSVDSLGKPREPSVAPRENAIVNVREIDKRYGEEAAKRDGDMAAAADPSNLRPPKPNQHSWIKSPSTPTVTLQKDGPGEEAEVLGSDNDSETRLDDGLPEPTDEDKDMARKIFDGDEAFVSKDRAAAWLGDP